MSQDFVLKISKSEQCRCLQIISKRLVRSIYVFEQTQIKAEQYNYKDYIRNILLFIQSADNFFDGQLVSVKINLNTILKNDLDKQQYKAIIFECKNYVEYLSNKIKDGEEI